MVNAYTHFASPSREPCLLAWRWHIGSKARLRVTRLRLAESLLLTSLFFGAGTSLPLQQRWLQRSDATRMRALGKIVSSFFSESDAISDKKVRGNCQALTIKTILSRHRLRCAACVARTGSDILRALLQGEKHVPGWTEQGRRAHAEYAATSVNMRIHMWTIPHRFGHSCGESTRGSGMPMSRKFGEISVQQENYDGNGPCRSRWGCRRSHKLPV